MPLGAEPWIILLRVGLLAVSQRTSRGDGRVSTAKYAMTLSFYDVMSVSVNFTIAADTAI